jgi:ADP-L-glycero-D-manno-heptose 6-epimerase
MIVVTGGAGFIGSALVAKLNGEGIKDIIVVDSLGHEQKWQNLNGKKFYDYYHKSRFLNLIEEDALDFNVDCVVHMGACSTTTATDAEYVMSNNYAYTKVIADWALDNGARFIYASSAATYGDGSLGYEDTESIVSSLKPLNLYGFSKNAFDICACDTKAIEHMVGLKFFNVYGPNEYHKGDQASIAFKGYDEIKKSGAIKLFKSHNSNYKDGEFYRDFVYVKDCVDVINWLINNKSVNGLYNLGTGKASTWNQLAKSLFAAMKLPENIQYIPMPEKLQNQYQYFTEAKMDKLAKAGCPIKMRTIEAGIEDYVSNHLSKPNRYW